MICYVTIYQVDLIRIENRRSHAPYTQHRRSQQI